MVFILFIQKYLVTIEHNFSLINEHNYMEFSTIEGYRVSYSSGLYRVFYFCLAYAKNKMAVMLSIELERRLQFLDTLQTPFLPLAICISLCALL